MFLTSLTAIDANSRMMYGFLMQPVPAADDMDTTDGSSLLLCVCTYYTDPVCMAISL